MNNLQIKLLEALRSGKFQQTANRLRSKDCYCAVGLACEIYRINTGHGCWTQVHYSSLHSFSVNTIYSGSTTRAPSEVVKAFNLKHASITTWNDVLGLSFAEIADHLEREWSNETK
jgi:hypothetical protein